MPLLEDFRTKATFQLSCFETINWDDALVEEEPEEAEDEESEDEIV